MEKMLIFNIGLLATPHGSTARRGKEQGQIELTRDAWVLIEDGKIAATGAGSAPCVPDAERVDAKQCLVTPRRRTRFSRRQAQRLTRCCILAQRRSRPRAATA